MTNFTPLSYNKIVKNLMVLPIILFFFLSFFLPEVGMVDAQLLNFDPSQIQLQNELVATLSPEVPAPGEKLEIRITSYSFDINRAAIVWRLNGKTVKQGMGETSLQMTAGKAGARDVISITAVTPDGQTASKTLTIRPAEVDILWEADSYVPAWYRGKALAGSESNIIFTALPLFYSSRGEKISPSELVYEWEIDHKRQPNSSGFGRYQLKTRGPQLFIPMLVEVSVSDMDGNISARKTIQVSGEKPKVIIYQGRPTEGVSANSSIRKELVMATEEESLVAEPYFFSASNLGGLSYSWQMNGAGVKTTKKPDTLTVRNSNGESGESRISVFIKNPTSFLQESAYDFLIKF